MDSTFKCRYFSDGSDSIDHAAVDAIPSWVYFIKSTMQGVHKCVKISDKDQNICFEATSPLIDMPACRNLRLHLLHRSPTVRLREV